MFGSKLKTWMENHIGRSKKKTQQEKEKVDRNGGKGVFLESSESLAQSDTGISSGSQQVLSSSTADNREGYCTTTIESDRSGMTRYLTSVSLPSPESAYSTGYSTDGASPGGTGPPEYYINIRTGKHYFPSPAPTPTSPQPNTAFPQLHSANHCLASSTSSSFLTNESALLHAIPPRSSTTHSTGVRSRLLSPLQAPNTRSPLSNAFGATPCPFKGIWSSGVSEKIPTSSPSHIDIFNSSSKSPCKPKSQLNSLKLFLKSPKQDKGKSKLDDGKTATFENKKSPGKSKKWYKQPFQKFGQKRANLCENNLKSEAKKDIFLDKNVYFLSKETTASPRQRNRIKTNPWLPTEPLSSQNFYSLQMNYPPNAQNHSCTNTPLQDRKTGQVLQKQVQELKVRYDEPKEFRSGFEKAVNHHVGQKANLEQSDHSEEDVTLNEMMGTCNESYIYEKETDILSDSDPTDCDDYVSDSEADNGGDEQDSHDDELDYIDNESVTESDDNFAENTGRCTYVYAKKNSFVQKCERRHSHREPEARRCLRAEKQVKSRQPMRKSVALDDPAQRRLENRPKIELNENVGGLNLNRVLMQRMLTRNGSKSADGTPVSIRRQNIIKELRETHIGDERMQMEPVKARGEVPAYLVDIEGDRKYNELIREAENIFRSIQNSPSSKVRNEVVSRDETAKDAGNSWRKDRLQSPEAARKSPRNLGLKLSVEEPPKRLKYMNFGKDNKSQFKGKSAHSPLDPLGPTFRNFSVFQSTDIDDGSISGSLSSEESEAESLAKAKPTVPESPVVPIAFQSVDLGKPLTSYCPQSEPVKRKIYSCSKTYDRLVKRFDQTPQIFEGSRKNRRAHDEGREHFRDSLSSNNPIIRKNIAQKKREDVSQGRKIRSNPSARQSHDANVFR